MTRYLFSVVLSTLLAVASSQLPPWYNYPSQPQPSNLLFPPVQPMDPRINVGRPLYPPAFQPNMFNPYGPPQQRPLFPPFKGRPGSVDFANVYPLFPSANTDIGQPQQPQIPVIGGGFQPNGGQPAPVQPGFVNPNQAAGSGQGLVPDQPPSQPPVVSTPAYSTPEPSVDPAANDQSNLINSVHAKAL